MARRRGKLGEYLAVDDYYGKATYASRLRKDHDGYWSEKPLARNLQEIASPLNDPRPVPAVGRSADYEQYDICTLKTAPLYVGLTNVKTSQLSAALQSAVWSGYSNQGIGDMEVGCSLIVR